METVAFHENTVHMCSNLLQNISILGRDGITKILRCELSVFNNSWKTFEFPDLNLTEQRNMDIEEKCANKNEILVDSLDKSGD